MFDDINVMGLPILFKIYLFFVPLCLIGNISLIVIGLKYAQKKMALS